MLIAVSLSAGGNRETSDESGAGGESATPIATDDSAVATVNGRPISREDFDEAVAGAVARNEAQAGQPLAPAQIAQIENQVLTTLITRAILMQRADDIGISVTDEQFDNRRDEFLAQFPNDTAYQGWLQQQGLTEEEFAEELRFALRVDTLLEDEVYSGIEVTEEEARAFYDENPQYFQQPEQVAARHILLNTQDLESEEDIAAKREEAEAIREELIAGADFAELARERSEGPSASRGGDLGTFGRGQMVPEFEEAAFALDEGQISEVVETQFGFHVLQVTEKVPARTVPFDETQPQIEEFLLDQERNTGARDYVNRLREDAEVEELLDRGAATE